MISRRVSLDGKMKRLSSLSSAIGLILLFSLNGVSLMPEDPADSGCHNTENWSASCGKTPKLITITEQIKKLLVIRHNAFRDIVASGYSHELPRAGRMCKLAWDPDLANVAKLQVMRCDLQPAKSCISTMKFPDPGYNAAYHKFKKKQDAFGIVSSQLNAWYGQHKFVDPLNLLGGSSSYRSEVGHFLPMMVGPSNRLGCALAATERDGWNYQWLTCLYSCSPKNNTLLYEFAPKPGNFCTTGVDRQFQHLCSDQEAVDGCRHIPLFKMASKIRTARSVGYLHRRSRNPGYNPLSGILETGNPRPRNQLRANPYQGYPPCQKYSHQRKSRSGYNQLRRNQRPGYPRPRNQRNPFPDDTHSIDPPPGDRLPDDPFADFPNLCKDIGSEPPSKNHSVPLPPSKNHSVPLPPSENHSVSLPPEKLKGPPKPPKPTYSPTRFISLSCIPGLHKAGLPKACILPHT